MEGHGKWMVWKMLIVGLLIILIRVYTDWDLFLIIGVVMIIKAIIMMAMPCCKTKGSVQPKRRR